MNQKIQPSKLRDLVLSSLDKIKAIDPVTISVRKISSFTDYMMIASGTSNRHIQSIGEKVLDDLKRKSIKPLGVEGKGSDEWLLIDIGEVVVHLMSSNARTFYDLAKTVFKNVNFKYSLDSFPAAIIP